MKEHCICIIKQQDHVGRIWMQRCFNQGVGEGTTPEYAYIKRRGTASNNRNLIVHVEDLDRIS